MNAQAAIIQVKMANAATIMKTRDDLIKLGANNEKARATPCCANKPRKLNFSSLPSFVTNLRHRSLPKGQHLLLVGRVAVRLNETAGPASQQFFWTRRSWAADVLAIEHGSPGVQKIMGYSKSNL
jgi:hypothetical protein